MIPLSLADLAALTGGRMVLPDLGAPPPVITGGVSADSRDVGPGGLFVALPGERTDGHLHAVEAVRAGAAAVLATRDTGVPAVLVDDAGTALARLARAILDRLPDVLVVGVTGSSGKTGTKDLLAAVLARAGRTVAPAGSFNNELGVPLTVLRATPDTRYLVIEMGARGLGHVAQLCRTAPPRIGVVLNVGAAHAGEFGDLEITARAKGELVEALPPDGLAVLNADDPRVSAMAGRSAAPVVLVGRSAAAEVRAEDVVLDDQARPAFVLCARGARTPVRLALHGEHHVGNALAAAAVGLAVGLRPEQVADALSAADPASRWRMEVRERPDGVRVVNDAYNANPDSVAAALRALAAMTAHGGRAWAVLGEMKELGAGSAAAHRAAGALAAGLGVHGVLAVGAGAAAVAEGAAAGGVAEVHAVPDPEAAAALLAELLRPGDAVLVKASRSVGLEHLAATLCAGASGPDHAESPLSGYPDIPVGTVSADGVPHS